MMKVEWKYHNFLQTNHTDINSNLDRFKRYSDGEQRSLNEKKFQRQDKNTFVLMMDCVFNSTSIQQKTLKTARIY